MQSSSSAPTPPERKHRNQMLVQVWLPLGFALLFVAALMGLVIFTSVTTTGEMVANGASASLILLIIPTFLGGFILLAVLGGLIYLMVKAYRGLPGQAHRVQELILRLNQLIQKTADASARPAINMRSRWAGVKHLTTRLAHPRSSSRSDTSIG